MEILDTLARIWPLVGITIIVVYLIGLGVVTRLFINCGEEDKEE